MEKYLKSSAQSAVNIIRMLLGQREKKIWLQHDNDDWRLSQSMHDVVDGLRSLPIHIAESELFSAFFGFCLDGSLTSTVGRAALLHAHIHFVSVPPTPLFFPANLFTIESAEHMKKKLKFMFVCLLFSTVSMIYTSVQAGRARELISKHFFRACSSRRRHNE